MLQLNQAVVDRLRFPQAIVFDWHGTLVDTLDAMYQAMEEMLPMLEELDLVASLLPEEECATEADARLVRYIRIFRRLHPRILAERRISRTEIFNAIFGSNTAAQDRAHAAYNRCYRNYIGEVRPFEPAVGQALAALHQLGIRLGVATNRSRAFLEQELSTVDGGQWRGVLEVLLCADDIGLYKPAPDLLIRAARQFGLPSDATIWYVGDSPTDMRTADLAGLTGIYYHPPLTPDESSRPPDSDEAGATGTPAAIVEGFNDLFDLLAMLEARAGPVARRPSVSSVRPDWCPPRAPLPERVEPDWHPAVARLTPPRLVLFDWHATLVDTLDAMYHAVDDLLQEELESLGLKTRLLPPSRSRTPEDARLVEHVRNYHKLHPKVRADRKISRTDIFEVLFGDDQEAKVLAHAAFNRHYRKHYGTVLPFEPRVRQMLEGLTSAGLGLGVITNRDREFFEHELLAVEGTGWAHLFDTQVCGDDVARRKPHPDQLLKATENLARRPGADVWYVGDSTTDTIAAKRAGMTSVFFNGAQWDHGWLTKIFPGDEAFPHKPDVVVNDFSEFWALVTAMTGADIHRKRQHR